MSAVLLVQSPGGIAIACDSASFLGDWQIPGGQPKVWTVKTRMGGQVIMAQCGNHRWRSYLPVSLIENWQMIDGAFDAEFCDRYAQAFVRDFAATAATLTDKRGDDGMLTTDMELLIVVAQCRRAYYIAGLTLTVIELPVGKRFAIGLGAGGVAAQAAATAFMARPPEDTQKHPLAVVGDSVAIACGMLSSCKYPIHSWQFLGGKWAQS